jgi:hypothetical protein
MPVAELLGGDTDSVRDQNHQRRTVAEPPLPGRVGVFQHPPRPGRIIGPEQHLRQLQGGGENVRIVVAEIGPPQVDGVLEHSAGRAQITRTSEALRMLPGTGEGGWLRHASHAAGYRPSTPGTPTVCTEKSGPASGADLPAGRRGHRVKFSIVRPAGLRLHGVKTKKQQQGVRMQVRVAEWQTR